MLNLSNLRATLSPYPARVRARRAYFAANDTALEVAGLLTGHDGHTAHGRALILSDLADLESSMADVITTAWPSPDSRDDAHVLQASSDLLRLIASTEAAEGRHFRQKGPDDWEAAFGRVLDDLAETNDPARRAELTVRLYLSVHSLLGGDVAETVAVISHAYIDLALAKQQQAIRDAEISMIGRNVNLVSFGYLHGAEPDSHHTEDLRPLRDPHVSPELRNLTANDQAVIDTVLATPGIPEVINYLAQVAYMLTGLTSDDTATTTTIAIGCSGGRHRAPAVTNALAHRLRSYGFTVHVEHRDLDKPVVNRATA